MNKTYEVTAIRSDGWWAIEITSGLPDHMIGVTQTPRVNNVEGAAIDVIVDLLECEPTDVEVNVTFELPERMQSALDLFSDAKELEANARAEASRMRSQAATDLLEAHLTMREAGHLLEISQQRVKQLVDRVDSDYAQAGEAARKRIVVLMADSPSYIDTEATTELSKLLSSMTSSELPAVGA